MNVFMEDKKEITFEDYMSYNREGRENLGDTLPVVVYRMFEYSMRSALNDEYGKEEQIKLFRTAGFKAGTFFAKEYLDCSLPFERFLGELQTKMEEMRIGILRVESVDEESGSMSIHCGAAG